MDSSTLSSLLFFLLLSIPTMAAVAQLEDGGGSGLAMAMGMANSIYPSNSYHPFGGEEDMIGDGDDDEDNDDDSSSSRRGLLWSHRRRYYISYGALSANRVPCPPRSGRSYYSHNCYRATGPVRPYSRGCSAITRCRR